MHQETLVIDHATEGEYDVIALRGEVDMSSYTQLRDRLNGLMDAGRARIVLDLSDTSFLDSTALGALIGGRRRAHAAGGHLVVVCDNPRLKRILEVTRLNLVFTIFDSLESWRQREVPN